LDFALEGALMTKTKSVSVARFFKDNEKNLKLQWISGKNGGDREITEGSIQRPGLALAGFFDYFADKRVHIIGMAEYAYLNSLTEQDRPGALMPLAKLR
jgi:HPr kinase/phosphorylase